jgi:hypothetical protein
MMKVHGAPLRPGQRFRYEGKLTLITASAIIPLACFGAHGFSPAVSRRPWEILSCGFRLVFSPEFLSFSSS